MNNEQIEVLLVEDNPNDVELTLRAFRLHNLVNKIHVVQDGAEALDFIFCEGAYKNRDIRKPPKVVILDLKLPKINGKEVLKRIKSDERTKIIPVVVMTSSQEESDIFETYNLGVNSFIVKPVDFEKFVDTVKELGMYWVFINKPPII
ncbi:MAG TPA: response regulator [Candidatus Omnitrophota bacterium]|nr:response regulator [Candidatus Omnitrophota bacterium]HPT06941.1 response regulator [Candidatus Omnitrophota bacterium]